MPINVYYRIADAKNDTSTIMIPLPDSVAITDLTQYVQDIAAILQPLINGTLLEAGFAVGVNVAPWSLAAGISDVQEKARFVFRTAGGFLKAISLPAVVESIFRPGSREVDTTDPNVAAFVTAMVDGITVNSNTIEPVDRRGEDLTNLVQATEAWGRARG